MTLEIADDFKRSPATIDGAIIKVEDLLRKDKSFEKEDGRGGQTFKIRFKVFGQATVIRKNWGQT